MKTMKNNTILKVISKNEFPKALEEFFNYKPVKIQVNLREDFCREIQKHQIKEGFKRIEYDQVPQNLYWKFVLENTYYFNLL